MEIEKLIEISKILIKEFSEFRQNYNRNLPLAKSVLKIPTPAEMHKILEETDDLDYLIEYGEKPTDAEKKRRIKIVPTTNWSKFHSHWGDEASYLVFPYKIFLSINPLVQSVVKKITSSFEDELQIISPKANKLEDVAITVFLNYFDKLLIEYVNNKLTDSKIKKYATIFLNQLRIKPTKHLAVNEIWGFTIEEGSTIKIGTHILKIASKEDFYQIEDNYPTNYYIDLELPRFILKLTSNYLDFVKISRIEQKILQLLRLYKNGPVNFGKKYRYRYSMIHNKLFFYNKAANYRPATYKLSKNEINQLTDFMKHFFPRLGKYPSPNDYHSISMERYNWSLNERLGMDRRLMFAVMGLEPLFLKDKEFGANSYKLGMRVSTFLKCLNLRPDDIRNDIVKGYRYRNIVIHGSIYPPDWADDVKSLYPKLLNYLRISILLFSEIRNKNKIIDLLEDSFTLKSKYKELKDLIYKNKETIDFVKMFL